MLFFTGAVATLCTAMMVKQAVMFCLSYCQASCKIYSLLGMGLLNLIFVVAYREIVLYFVSPVSQVNACATHAISC